MTSTPLDLFRVYDRDTDWINGDGYPGAWHAAHAADGTFVGGIKHLVRRQAGDRCIRCGHPYTKGEGEWSACDMHCTHLGPVRFRDAHIGPDGGWSEQDMDTWGHPFDVVEPGPSGEPILRWECQARWRILTVHHLNEVKIDCRWWNLASLCQRCHLTIQGKVKLSRPFLREHTPWFKPYAAGWYAAKYLGENLTREEVEAQLDDLLRLELVESPLFDREGRMTESGRITYHMLTSADDGETWAHKGTQAATSKESAQSKFFPAAERTIGHQYVAVASSHWQPVVQSVREVPYTRRVESLQPVGQTTLLDDVAVEETSRESQVANADLQQSVDKGAADGETEPLQVPEEEEVPV